MLAAAEPALVVAADVLVADRAVAHPHVVVSMAAEPDEVLAGLRRGDAPPAPVLTDPDAPDRLVTVVFTSGTTGLPKGAMFANAELAAVTRADLDPERGSGAAAVRCSRAPSAPTSAS